MVTGWLIGHPYMSTNAHLKCIGVSTNVHQKSMYSHNLQSNTHYKYILATYAGTHSTDKGTAKGSASNYNILSLVLQLTSNGKAQGTLR